ncbi:MAG: UvrB/UvrC motif-containing protein [Gemmatimonadota bacterium]|nr:UvrB/UvrC motif-containing protein [Gemmatimonadota bacterium]MDH5759104.1 UvrB/UvrC motif-containing protein [Gemmatimonadota bacterium]
MACDNCGVGDAVVHLTQIVNNEMTTYHLCERCAAEKGLDTTPAPPNFPITDFLAKMGGHAVEGDAPSPDLTCGFCGLSFADFKESGRLGCPQCYSAFEAPLRGLLRRIHGGTRHVGKVYLPPDPTANEVEKRLEGLRRRLERAVSVEDFERAAALRDEIRTLEIPS